MIKRTDVKSLQLLRYSKPTVCMKLKGNDEVISVLKEEKEYVKKLVKKSNMWYNYLWLLKVGKKYGITDNAVRKHCKRLNLPYKTSDIKSYSDEEWKEE